MNVEVINGDSLVALSRLESKSVHCCVTSPPYFGLRDYQQAGQIGLEKTLEAYIAALVGVFAEVRRVLRDDGVLWLNIGDSYASRKRQTQPATVGAITRGNAGAMTAVVAPRAPGFREKELMGVPWRLAFALQADGWFLRQDIIWSKPNTTPESVTDRCTRSHEYIFMFTKGPRYFFDAAAIAEPVSQSMVDQMKAGYEGAATKDYEAGGAQDPSAMKSRVIAGALKRSGNKARKVGAERGAPEGMGSNLGGSIPWEGLTRNKRSVWTVSPQPFGEGHFATFPPKLIEPCILSTCPQGGTVLDPFGGAGTTGLVADRHHRNAILIELNPDYVDIAVRRIRADGQMLTTVQVKAAA